MWKSNWLIGLEFVAHQTSNFMAENGNQRPSISKLHEEWKCIKKSCFNHSSQCTIYIMLKRIYWYKCFWCSLLIRLRSCDSRIFIRSHTISARLWLWKHTPPSTRPNKPLWKSLRGIWLIFQRIKTVEREEKKIGTDSQFYPCCFDKCCKTVSKNWKKRSKPIQSTVSLNARR